MELKKVFSNLALTFRQMKLREHLFYWILPVILCWIFALMYFAGPVWMQNFIAHPYNREFGLLENLENILLLFIIIFAFILFRRSQEQVLKFIWFIAVLGFGFLFLEEIDYGYHF